VKLDYLLMHGAGNRILVVDSRGHDAQPPSGDALRRLADPAAGPGFDQLMWVMSPRDSTLDAGYRIFNADGSEVGQCGNGVRCVAALLAATPGHPQAFLLESPSGPVEARIGERGLVSVSMGTPGFEPADIPFVAPERLDRYELEVDGVAYDVAAVSMGNPHCVLQVDDVDTAPVADLGPKIEGHVRFPEKANVGFVCIRGRDRIDLRVYERGVGETAACGTGACAAVVTGQNLGLLDADVEVRLPGGQLMVSWHGGSEPVWLTGNAETLSEGFIEI